MSGIATNRTNITLPTDVSGEIMQKVQEQSAVMRFARKIDLPGRGLTIPVITSDPEAAWVAETDAKPVSNPGLSQKIMSGYTLAVIVPFSNQFRRDAGALYNALVERLPLALAAKFDATVFNGTAPGSNFDVLTSCTAHSLVTNVYDGIVAADTAIAEAGGMNSGFVISPLGRGILLGAKDGSQRPLFVNSVAEGAIPMILGVPTIISKACYKQATSPNLDVVGFCGDWSQAMYGVVEGIDISISDQATVTLSDSTVVNLWQRNMFAVRAEIEVGFRADTNCFMKLAYTGSGS